MFQSEERGKEEYATSDKPQDIRIAKSAGNSLDKLAGSSVDPDGKFLKYCSVRITVITLKYIAVIFQINLE